MKAVRKAEMSKKSRISSSAKSGGVGQGSAAGSGKMKSMTTGRWSEENPETVNGLTGKERAGSGIWLALTMPEPVERKMNLRREMAMESW